MFYMTVFHIYGSMEIKKIENEKNKLNPSMRTCNRCLRTSKPWWQPTISQTYFWIGSLSVVGIYTKQYHYVNQYEQLLKLDTNGQISQTMVQSPGVYSSLPSKIGQWKCTCLKIWLNFTLTQNLLLQYLNIVL